MEKHPVQVVAEWLGNTSRVAMRRYLITTDEHFDAAVKGDEPTAEVATAKTAQNPAQQAHAGCRGHSQSSNPAHEKTPALLGLTSSGDLVQLPEIAGLPPEPYPCLSSCTW